MPLSPWAALRIALGIGLAYVLAGSAALLLAGPPGYAAPLFPPAGIALAAAMTYGRWALPGVFAGALAVELGLGVVLGKSGLTLAIVSLLIAGGAALQAAAGAALIRRYVGQDVVLNAPREIARFGALCALAACLVSPSIATPVLVLSGAVASTEAGITWLTWWTGDALGMLVAAPLALAFIGRPAADWRPRRRTLALPLMLALGLVAAVMVETSRLDDARRRAVFERDADRLAAEALTRLAGAQHALQALHGAARLTGGFDREGLREASRWWLMEPLHLQATGYGVRLPVDRVAEFEASARAQGLAGFRVFDRDQGRDRTARGEVLAVRHIEPERDNAGALGVNSLSIPAAHDAILAARDSGLPAASAAFALTQSATGETGVVLYQTLYEGQAPTPAARAAQWRSVVFVTLRTESALADIAPASRAFLRWCLIDTGPGSGQRRWAGPTGCEAATADQRHFQHQRSIAWGGRTLSLSVHADPAQVPGHERESTWLLAITGMTALALLGALLLTVTGHSRRTQLAVRASTEKLRGQVSERQRTEAALRESGERLRSILDNVPLGVMFLDPNGQLIECNLRFAEMARTPMPQLLGRSVADFVHPDDAAVIRRLRRELLEGKAREIIEAIRLRHDGGAETTVRVSASALRDPEGRLVRMVGVIEDITERLRLEASERALHRAEAANRAKSDFLSRMSHELRTPLNAMIGFAQLLGLDRDPALAAHQREWTQQIQRAGWHLLEMINETLDLARIESGAVQLKQVPVDVAPMVAACRAMLAGTAAQRGIEIIEELTPDASTMLGDATRVKQVLTNLLSNAVKYNRDGGSVRVQARRSGSDQIAIAVVDTGLGMSATQLEALFQPYNRLGRESSGIEGTGIGLVISRRLTELMGGTLTVTSRAGSGSTFTVTLPAAAQAERPKPRYSESAPAPYQQRLVHYVEDNETNIEVMRGILAQRPQILLRTSMLGLDGLAAIRRDRPDLILLDMHLPDISGLELLRHLKQDEEIADIPVIVVSADATSVHMAEALTLGAVHYVTKPVDVAAFLPLLDNALEAVDTRWGM